MDVLEGHKCVEQSSARGHRRCEQMQDEDVCEEPIVRLVSLQSDTCITRQMGFENVIKERTGFDFGCSSSSFGGGGGDASLECVHVI